MKIDEAFPKTICVSLDRFEVVCKDSTVSVPALKTWRHLSCSRPWEGNGPQLQYSCLENPMDGGAWWAAVHGVDESNTAEQLHFHFSLSCIGEGNGNSLQCSCLENPRDRGAWWASIYGVAQSRTQLKRLSSSSSSIPAGFKLFCVCVWKNEFYFFNKF